MNTSNRLTIRKGKNMDELVSIILVNYNTIDDTIECVQSLEKIKYPNFNIIIVENGSKDKEKIKSNKYLNKTCDVLISDTNDGFSAGNNIGLCYARKRYNPDYYLLLNNDTVVDANFLNEMVEASKNNSSAAITGKIYYYNNRNKVDYVGGFFDKKEGIAKYYPIEDIAHTDITFATGCLLLIPDVVLDTIGNLDESYFMYGEDVEYSLRIVQNGFRLVYCDSAKIYHKISASTHYNSLFNQYYLIRNNLYNAKKYAENGNKALAYNALHHVCDILKGNQNIKVTIQAWRDFFKNIRGRSERY